MSADGPRGTIRPMIDFTLETHIARSPAAVFAYVVDPSKLPSWQTNTVSSVPDGPLGVGTKLREVHRAPGGKELVSVVQVARFDPGRAFSLRVIEGTPVHLDMGFATAGGGTRLTFRVFGEVGGVKSRLLRPVLRRQFARQLETLRSVLEQLDPVPERV
jgi:uncharacterized protein YndB with AHSA1/START domain